MANNFLKPKDLIAKYGWGRNKAQELIHIIKNKFNLTYKENIIKEDLYLRYFEE